MESGGRGLGVDGDGRGVGQSPPAGTEQGGAHLGGREASQRPAGADEDAGAEAEADADAAALGDVPVVYQVGGDGMPVLSF